MTKRAYRRTPGSPPQVRGKLVFTEGTDIPLRITPAGAGKTQHESAAFAATRDHPRRCGENGPNGAISDTPSGSPPQVRGKPFYPQSIRTGKGITPAGAGKTEIRPVDFFVKSDHPRRCGENSFEGASLQSASGSPPQVRGKRCGAASGVRRDRITPAGAGKTLDSIAFRQLKRDHPRRCGENDASWIDDEKIQGSPPQVRGKPFGGNYKKIRARITPAGAGKTTRHRRSHRRSRDHPRRCGENMMSSARPMSNLGSPPQVRGKQTLLGSSTSETGITPAGAGKTRTSPNLYGSTEDHPRRCGENFRGFFRVSAERGSPPQVRGKLTQSSMSILHTGITPAGAGKTSLRQNIYSTMEDHPRRCGENTKKIL